MKNLLYLLIFSTYFSYGQSYYGYKSRSSNNQTEENNNRINCEDAIKLVENKGRYLDVSFGGYASDAIEKIKWYTHNGFLYSIVYFKRTNEKGYSSSKGYIYGGWKYEFNSYYELKKTFESTKSTGKFFWEYIEQSKIDCD
jgi:hypothetical protein